MINIQSSYIYLRNLHFHAFHGVMPQERKVGADFVLSLRIGYDIIKAMETDKVSDTLNYAAVYALVREEMESPSSLLEHVAGRIANAVVQHFPNVTCVDLWLTKQNPPLGADCDGAGVELHLINDKTHG